MIQIIAKHKTKVLIARHSIDFVIQVLDSHRHLSTNSCWKFVSSIIFGIRTDTSIHKAM